MARPTRARANAHRANAQRANVLRTLTAAGVPESVAKRVSASAKASEFTNAETLAGSASVFKPGAKTNPYTDRGMIAQPWQHEVYRHVGICGEARYAAVLYSNVAGRAEIGISEPQALVRKAVWVKDGPEVDVLNEIAPTVRDRTALIRSFMLHWVIAGECYLIARARTDVDPPSRSRVIWEIVAVTELRKTGMGETSRWQVRYDNGHYIDLDPNDPVIRLWNPDPENRREAWSPFKSMLSTLREIEWLTKHIFTQVRSRLLGAGVWFLPENLTFAPPPPDAVEGGAEAIAQMNEAERFMVSLADSSMEMLEGDEVGFPSVVMADAAALANVDQAKLIQFWSNIDKAAMELRTDAIRRFALGMDMPSGKAVDPVTVASGPNGGSGGANHWGKWADQEEMISEHIEPALDAFTGSLTTALLWLAVDNTDKVIAYDTASLRLKQDRSKEAIEWYDRGELKADVALRETGFDPSSDQMDDDEFRRWVLKKMVSGNPSPEMIQAAASLLNVALPMPAIESGGRGGGTPGSAEDRSLDDHPYEGPPREQHDHSPAPYALARGGDAARVAAAEGLVLRALEKAGNRLLNTGYRGRSKPTGVIAHHAHTQMGLYSPGDEVNFDFTMAPEVFDDLDAREVGTLVRQMTRFCAELYDTRTPYSRERLIQTVKGL